MKLKWLARGRRYALYSRPPVVFVPAISKMRIWILIRALLRMARAYVCKGAEREREREREGGRDENNGKVARASAILNIAARAAIFAFSLAQNICAAVVSARQYYAYHVYSDQKRRQQLYVQRERVQR